MQTLRQLLPPEALDPATAPPDAWHWPNVTVTDAPRLPWRGRAARRRPALHAAGVPATGSSTYWPCTSVNVLHLHLTDDQGWRIEIDGWPLLTEVGCVAQPRSMVGRPGSGGSTASRTAATTPRPNCATSSRFAADRGVTDRAGDRPARARARRAGRLPRTGQPPRVSGCRCGRGWGISEDILGVHDEALDFCREVLHEVSACSRRPYVHIGGDECPTDAVGGEPGRPAAGRALGLPDTAALQRLVPRPVARLPRRTWAARAVCWDETGHAAGTAAAGRWS